MSKRPKIVVVGAGPTGLVLAALLPVAYFTGETFKTAPRLPAATVTHVDRWGAHPEG